MAFGVWLFAISNAQAITFKGPPVIPTATDVLDFVTADVNNDGKPDIVYIDGQPNGVRAVHVLLNNGNGKFIDAQDIGLPAGVCCNLTVADINGDAKPDLVLSGNSSTAVLIAGLLGNGDGTFQVPVLSSFLPNGFNGFPKLIGLSAGDLNGDGKIDLALFTGQDVYILLGNGSGGFSFTSDLLAAQNGAVADHIALADLNGDGHLDIFTTDNIGADFEVFLGNGNGFFANYVRYSANTPAGPFFLTDVDRDGHLDVLTSYYLANSPNQIGYFKGNPDGTFSTTLTNIGATPSPSNPLYAAADLNGDGIADLIFLTPSGLAVSLGGSSLSFSPALTTISGGSMSPYSTLPSKQLVADFNGDGHVDLAIAVEGGIGLLLGNGDGTFVSDQFYDMVQPVGSAAVAKFSGSGNMDVAVSLPAALPRLLLGDGNGGFTLGPDPNANYGSQTPFLTVLAADFNGNGKPDLNVGNMIPNANSSGTQSVEFNQGSGVFSTPISVPNSSPIMADFNHDGRTDIVNVTGQQIIVSLGQANGSFTTATTALRNALGSAFFNAGDVNNDGKPDLILNYLDHLEIWLGNGDGTFSYGSSVSLPNGISGGVAAVADVDGDGNADIVLAPANYTDSTPIAIFFGSGNGTFPSSVVLPTSRAYQHVVVADVNRDNLPDLVMTDGATVAVILNLGGRKFDSEVIYIAGRSITGLNVVDINSDGYPDIVVANGDGYPAVQGPNFSGTTVTVLLNQPNGTSPDGLPVNGNLSVAPEPSQAAQPFTITLAVSAQATGGPVPTGTVGFGVDGAFITDVPTTNGSASYTYSSALIPVQHTITATYNGDSTYAPRSFSTIHVVQPPTYATSTTLQAAPATVLASQTVRLTATVTSVGAVPGGVVTFLDAGNTIGSAPLASGVAYFDTGLLAPGAHSLSATFDGFTESAFTGTRSYIAATFTPSTSVGTTVAVNTDGTAVSLSSSSTTATAGTVLTFASQVTSNAGVPFGSVSFYDGSNLLGTLALSAQAQASFSTASLAVGSHSIQAAFDANGPFGGSVSPVQTITVSAAPASSVGSLVTLAMEFDSSTGSSSLRAVVSGGDGVNTGVVTFLDSGAILRSLPIDSSGEATMAFFAGNGKHALTASFGGTEKFAPSVSPVLNDQWPSSGPGFAIKLAPELGRGAPAAGALQVSVVALGNFRRSIELACADGLPRGYHCNFSPKVLEGSGNSTMTILPPLPAALSHSAAVFWGWGAALACFAFLGKRKQQTQLLVLVIGITMMAAMNGCTKVGEPATQTAVITVQASSGSGDQAIIHSVQIPVHLTVK